MRRTAGYTWTDYKTNLHNAKELEITPVLDKLSEYKRNWIQHVNRMPRNRLPRIMKHYSPIDRRNRGRPLKRLLDTWDRNGSTSGLTPWQTYDDDEVLTSKSVGTGPSSYEERIYRAAVSQRLRNTGLDEVANNLFGTWGGPTTIY